MALPLEMNAVFRPAGRAALNTSTAHSAVISGSLYEDPTMRAPWRTARPTSSSGVTSRGMTPAVSSRSACEVSQFWQYPQWKSQPSMPNVSVSLPGRQWKKGFFSVGSHCKAAT